MLIYLFILALLCFLTAATLTRTEIHKTIYWFSLIFLFLFCAYRLEVGCDWTGYQNIFQLAKTTDWSLLIYSFDPGFMLLNKIVVAFDLPYTYVNVFSALLFFGGIHALAREQTNRLSFLLFTFPVMVLNLPMSALRQGIAIGILCFAFVYFLRNRKFWFAITVLIASSFHSSAIIFIALTPFAGMMLTRQRLFGLMVLMAVVLLFLATRPVGQQAIDRYVDASIHSSGAIFRILYLAIPCLFFIVFIRNAWRRDFPADYTLVLLSTLLFFASILSLAISTTVADRLAYYFYPAQAIILSRLPQFYDGKLKILVVSSSYLLMFLFFFFWVSFSGLFSQCYVPYDFGISWNGEGSQ